MQRNLERLAITMDAAAFLRARAAESEALLDVQTIEKELEEHRREHLEESQAGGSSFAFKASLRGPLVCSSTYWFVHFSTGVVRSGVPCEICESLERELSFLGEQHRMALGNVCRLAATEDIVAYQRAKSFESRANLEVLVVEKEIDRHRRIHVNGLSSCFSSSR